MEQTEQRGEREEGRAGRGWGQREGMGLVVQGLGSRGEDSGLYPEGGRSPEGLWAEEGWGLFYIL